MDWSSNKLPERLPFSKKRLPKKVVFSYILDYVIIVVLIITFLVIDKVTPFHQHFSLQNYTLHYPFAVKERVPVFELVLICVAAPALIIAFYTLVIDGIFSHQTTMPANPRGSRRLTGRYRLKDRLWELNCGILGLMLSVGAAFTITGALKNAIGKPRPDLIDRCQPNDDVKKNYNTLGFGDPSDWKLSTIEICTQINQAILQDGFKSFPSGHSSTAFAGLFYLSLYLAAKMHVLDSKGEVWKTFVVMVPTLGAALVAGSRIMDARHHPFDVLSGSALGLLVAWGSYRQYFPPVSETWRKGRAYPIRAWGRQPERTPAIHIDEDVVPLRPMDGSRDVEEGASSGFSSHTAVPGGSDEHGGNVFRQQILESQRRRQADRPFAVQHSDTMGSNYGVQHTDTMGPSFGVQHSDTMGSTLSTKVARYQGNLPSTNPFANDHRARGRDTYDYSSSEDDEPYELSQSYNYAAPPGGSAYNPIAGGLTDTGYHPPTGISPVPTPPPANAGAPQPVSNAAPSTGDLGELTAAPAPSAPPHAAGTTS